MKRLIAIIMLVIAALPLMLAQSADDHQKSAEDLFTRITAADSDSVKIALAPDLQKEVVAAIEASGNFYYAFSSIGRIGNRISPDQMVNMYSWNILLSDGSSLYYAVFNNRKYNRVYAISSTSPFSPSTKDVYDSGSWYGAIYYEINPVFHRNDETEYILFGLMIPGGVPYRQKVVEIITFTEDGIVFGHKDLFDHPEAGELARLKFEYAADASMSLVYNAKRKEVYFDHLYPVRKTAEGYVLYGPDMSVDAFRFRRDTWRYRDDVHVKNDPEPKRK